MTIKRANVYLIVLATGFSLPIIFAALADFRLTAFMRPNSGYDTLLALAFFGLWPAAIMFQNSIIFFSKNGFPFLILSDCINMTLYICVCGGIYLSGKIKASEFRPFIILVSYVLGAVAAAAISFVMILR